MSDMSKEYKESLRVREKFSTDHAEFIKMFFEINPIPINAIPARG